MTQLQETAGVSAATIAKLGRGDNVTTEVLLRIATALECGVEDLFETSDIKSPDSLARGTCLDMSQYSHDMPSGI
ncbi:helix-turn-helix domain-containing protein [Schaalia sp. lx-100]|uniref:helix-turn-helix domain-containing protein n=1 Tax=Schaalia sp. lx-100 TaxID=2899081 RepID=UPI001E5D9B1A|nr:helix-turn-helix transcriptional regulator [Schaalia sp. lx-100]MCD4557716.1 helix-turn-helix transcriptional regulator [Schaalia sp. lx-100]